MNTDVGVSVCDQPFENGETTDMHLSPAVKLAEDYDLSMDIFKQGQCYDRKNVDVNKKI